MEEEYDLVVDFEGTKRYEKILSALGYSDKAIRYLSTSRLWEDFRIPT
jgi:hypothetical protein